MQKRAIFSLFLMICTQTSRVMIYQYSVMDKKSRIKMIRLFWWAGVDSNHRRNFRQIYSLLHLATLEPTQILRCFLKWSRLSESNQQPADYKSAALPVELSRHFWCLGADLNHRHGDFQSPALPTELPRQKIGDPEGTRTLDL